MLNDRVLSFMDENGVLSLHLEVYAGLCEAFKCHAGVLFKRQLVPRLWLTRGGGRKHISFLFYMWIGQAAVHGTSKPLDSRGGMGAEE